MRQNIAFFNHGVGKPNLHVIWSSPDFFSILEFEPVHRDPYLLSVYLYKQVVIVQVFALEWVIRAAFNGICMRSTTPSDEVDYPVALVAFVVVDVSREYQDAKVSISLALL